VSWAYKTRRGIRSHLLLHRIRLVASRLRVVFQLPVDLRLPVDLWLPVNLRLVAGFRLLRAASVGLWLSAIVRLPSSVVRRIFRLFWRQLWKRALHLALPSRRSSFHRLRNNNLPIVGCEGIR